MAPRIGSRPPTYVAKFPKTRTYSIGAVKRGKDAQKGWSQEDVLAKGKALAQRLPLQLLEPQSRAAKWARRKLETYANVGYRGAFVMMDLTQTDAHTRRQAAMAEIAYAHDTYERRQGGSGFLYQGEHVHADESHISMVRGVAAPLLHPEAVAAGGEMPHMGHLAAFRAIAHQPAARLALDNAITYWTGPAKGPAKYIVAAVLIKDPQGALDKMQQAWAASGGTFSPADKPMHLTLAYLNLDHAKLPEDVAQRVLMRLRGDKGTPASWTQTDVYYSGRYGKEFARAKLKGQ